MSNQPAPPAKVHIASELSTATNYLSSYKDVYQLDRTDAGLVYLLIGFQNYLNALPSGAGALNALKISGYV